MRISPRPRQLKEFAENQQYLETTSPTDDRADGEQLESLKTKAAQDLLH
jgi:hypothetical protein